MCPETWARLGLGEGPKWILMLNEAGRPELTSEIDTSFGTALCALLQIGDLALRFIEEVPRAFLPVLLVSINFTCTGQVM